MKTLMSIGSALLLAFSPQSNDGILLNRAIMDGADKWRIVNDGVMGGLSISRVSAGSKDKIIFSGRLSLENNGGFASLRSPVKNYNFENFTGIEIRLKGDGKIFSISMKETSYFTGYFYTANFKTTEGEWVTHRIPFKEFSFFYFGRLIRRNPEIPLNRIKEISFLAGEKQEGDFSAEIEYIGLYK